MTALPDNGSVLLLLDHFWGVPARLSSGYLTVKWQPGEQGNTRQMKCLDNFFIYKGGGDFPLLLNAFWLAIKRELSSIIPTNVLRAVTCVLRSLLLLQTSARLNSRF